MPIREVRCISEGTWQISSQSPETDLIRDFTTCRCLLPTCKHIVVPATLWLCMRSINKIEGRYISKHPGGKKRSAPYIITWRKLQRHTFIPRRMSGVEENNIVTYERFSFSVFICLYDNDNYYSQTVEWSLSFLIYAKWRLSLKLAVFA